ncbi:MAG: helix-turn-helix domain-containing protein [Actinomycetota bacterium]|nr:helix-turn-helix domain-containing protein [Actinomycetota bacterium]
MLDGPTKDSPSRLAIDLRDALGLTQEELAAALGVDKRTLSRIEMREIELAGPMLAALELLSRISVADVPRTLEELARHHLAQEGGGEIPALLEKSSASLEKLLLQLPQSRREAMRGAPLGRLVASLWEAGRPWVYWATRARADLPTTSDLAKRHGIICRPLFTDRGEPQPYLFRLRPGDDVLLCYDEVPAAWFRIRRGDEPPVRIELDRPVSDLAGILVRLPPILSFIPQESELGRVLRQADYRLLDNSPPGRRTSGRFFSALRVEPSRRALPLGGPEPRARGSRFAITPFGARAPG